MQKTGVYVLIGADSDNPGRRKVYIGEGDTILTRLSSHNKDPDKDFWDEAVFFVSKDENLTKAHVRFLEARLISLATAAKRATVINSTAPLEQGKLPEADEVEMNEFIVQARLLLGALGYDLFESPPAVVLKVPEAGAVDSSPPPPEFVYSGEGFSAECVVDLDAGQFVVKAGSKARRLESPSLQPTYKNLRSQLQASGVLTSFDASSLVFSQDYSFSAITAAAQVVSGTTVNGRTVWKTKVGDTTFADWQDEQLTDGV